MWFFSSVWLPIKKIIKWDILFLRLCSHLVDVQLSAKAIESLVQILEHVDDHHWSRGRAYGGETDDVAEQHCHVRVSFCLDRLACHRNRRDESILLDRHGESLGGGTITTIVKLRCSLRVNLSLPLFPFAIILFAILPAAPPSILAVQLNSTSWVPLEFSKLVRILEIYD